MHAENAVISINITAVIWKKIVSFHIKVNRQIQLYLFHVKG